MKQPFPPEFRLPDAAEWPPVHLAPQIILPNELRVRYVTVGDQSAEAREQWMKAVFHFFLEFPYVPDDTSCLSTALGDFDAIVIGTNDLKRLLPFYRRNRSVLQRRLVVCLFKGSTPQRRAKAIFAGYDDAIDIERVTPAEAVARLRAMWLRYQVHAVREQERARETAALAALCHVDKLTAKEKRLLETLAAAAGQTVSMTKLLGAASKSHEPISEMNLRVSISLLRRKLRPGLQIDAAQGLGYALVQTN